MQTKEQRPIIRFAPPRGGRYRTNQGCRQGRTVATGHPAPHGPPTWVPGSWPDTRRDAIWRAVTDFTTPSLIKCCDFRSALLRETCAKPASGLRAISRPMVMTVCLARPTVVASALAVTRPVGTPVGRKPLL